MNLGCWIAGWPNRSLPTRLVALTAVMLAAYGSASVVVVTKGGAMGLAAMSLAAGVCLASAGAALLLSHSLRDPASGVAGVLLPMMVRTGLPLLLAIIIRIRGQGLVEAGLVYYLVGFYLLALAVEIPMSLPSLQRSLPCPEESGRKGERLHG
jgi:hypothetical protein